MKRFNFIPAVNENGKTIEYPDCVHLSDSLKCGILREKRCAGEKCSFFRTGAQFEESLRKSRRLLNALSTDKQEKIAVSYHLGKMPWKESD